MAIKKKSLAPETPAAKSAPVVVPPKAKPKVGIQVGILGDSESFHAAKGEREYYQALRDLAVEGTVVEKWINPAEVVSRQIHPVTIAYNGLSMVIPPRGKVIIPDMSKLGSCPKGIFVIPRPHYKEA